MNDGCGRPRLHRKRRVAAAGKACANLVGTMYFVAYILAATFGSTDSPPGNNPGFSATAGAFWKCVALRCVVLYVGFAIEHPDEETQQQQGNWKGKGCAEEGAPAATLNPDAPKDQSTAVVSSTAGVSGA